MATRLPRTDRQPLSVFLVFLRLGLSSFGGPVAHLGYFREEFVVRRQWLSERNYADLVALCQFLPGPASSQVGMALGLSRAGYAGALAAWLGFTAPSAVMLILFALGLSRYGEHLPAGLLHGLQVVAVAVVAQAVWGMARTLCTGWQRKCLTVLTAGVILLIPSAWTQVVLIVLAGLAGRRLFHPTEPQHHDAMAVPVSRRAGVICLSLFWGLLLGLPLLASLLPWQVLQVADAFYRAGSLVFGGGHVVLPLLQSEVVPTGWVSNADFLTGYGAAQAIPGPLFTFSAFLGASMRGALHGWTGGLLCLIAVFLPSFLLIAGSLPFWEGLRRLQWARGALAGINAAVVGLLLAALYDPVATSAIQGPSDFVLVLLCLGALMVWKLPAWLVVVTTGVAGWGIDLLV